MESIAVLEWVGMPLVMRSTLKSYVVGRSLLKFGFVGIENVLQFSGQTSCVRQLSFTQSISDGMFTSYNSDVFGS